MMMKARIRQTRLFDLSIVRMIVILLGGVVGPSTATAATYYVAKNGSDNNPGTETQPFLTVNKGVSLLFAGDALYVKAGTYQEGLHSITPRSGTSSAPITIARFGSDQVVFKPNMVQFSNVSYVTYDGFILDHTGIKGEFWFGNGSHHITARNIEVKNGAGIGVMVNNTTNHITLSKCIVHNGGTTDFDNAIYVSSSDNVVEGCEVYSYAGAGIQLYDGNSGVVNRNIVRDNYIHDTSGGNRSGRGQGIILANGSGNLCYNNILANIIGYTSLVHGGSAGIMLFSDGNNNQVYNNTVYNTGVSDGIQVGPIQTNAKIQNNIIYQTGGIYDVGSSTTLSNNLTTDPSFTNASGHDFTLQSSSSAIDQGITISVVQNDYAGAPRPQGTSSDIGAYEFSTSLSVPGPPNGLTVVTNP